jgi:hypothetical protein
MADDQEPSFGWLVLRKAVADTKEFFGSTTRDVAMGAFLAVLGFANYWRRYGLPAVRDEFLSAFYSTFEPLLIVVAMVFVWHLWLAPAAIAYEAARTAFKQRNTTSKQPPQPKTQPPVKWAIWKQMERYKAQEFAAILAKNDPASSMSSTEQEAFLRLIIEQMRTKALSYVRRYSQDYLSGGTEEIDPNEFTEIKRIDAIKWAQSRDFDVSHIK